MLGRLVCLCLCLCLSVCHLSLSLSLSLCVCVCVKSITTYLPSSTSPRHTNPNDPKEVFGSFFLVFNLCWCCVGMRFSFVLCGLRVQNSSPLVYLFTTFFFFSSICVGSVHILSLVIACISCLWVASFILYISVATFSMTILCIACIFFDWLILHRLDLICCDNVDLI
jgi:hypothetical protein